MPQQTSSREAWPPAQPGKPGAAQGSTAGRGGGWPEPYGPSRRSRACLTPRPVPGVAAMWNNVKGDCFRRVSASPGPIWCLAHGLHN